MERNEKEKDEKDNDDVGFCDWDSVFCPFRPVNVSTLAIHPPGNIFSSFLVFFKKGKQIKEFNCQLRSLFI